MAAYLAMIFVLSSLPHPLPYSEEIEKKHLDWILHGVEYAVLGILLMGALESSRPRKPFSSLFLLCFLLGTAVAVSDEWHQSFVPSRDASAADVAADAAGLCAAASIKALRAKKQKQGTR